MDRPGRPLTDPNERLEGPAGVPDGEDEESPPFHDGWELDEQLRHVGRVLEVAPEKPVPTPATPLALPSRSLRIDAAHPGPAGRHAPGSDRGAPARDSDSSAVDLALALLIWTVAPLGVMASVCGGVLLGWSMATGRHDLWTLGLPIALGGQVALVVGLILQLDRLWQANRHTAQKVEHVDARLHQLKGATAAVDAAHDGPRGAFHAHWAGGAGPEALLADLRGQLDLLAAKLHEQGQGGPP